MPLTLLNRLSGKKLDKVYTEIPSPQQTMRTASLKIHPALLKSTNSFRHNLPIISSWSLKLSDPYNVDTNVEMRAHSDFLFSSSLLSQCKWPFPCPLLTSWCSFKIFHLSIFFLFLFVLSTCHHYFLQLAVVILRQPIPPRDLYITFLKCLNVYIQWQNKEMNYVLSNLGRVTL